MRLLKALLLAGFALAASGAAAQTVKIGFITSYSGLNGNLGPYMERAVRLYIKQHQHELPKGVKIELITRDDTGPNPDKAKQLAQELIVRERVNLLAGVIFTPNALAIAPLATEALRGRARLFTGEAIAIFKLTDTLLSKAEEALCAEIKGDSNAKNFAARFNLKELTALITFSFLFISNSTGPLHIAAAMDKYTIGFYPNLLPCSYKRWGPYSLKAKVFTPKKECQDCSREQCSSLECMRAVKVTTVFAEVEKICSFFA